MDPQLFIEVILPIPLADSYTYKVPEPLQGKISAGSMVLVEFGKNKHYSGIVAYLHSIPPHCEFEIKEIIAIESILPVLRRPQLRFWEWLAQYYFCKLGEVYKAVLPSGFRTENTFNYKPKKEQFICITKDYLKYEALHQAFDRIKRAPKQEQLLLAYIDYSRVFSNLDKKEITRKELLSRSQLSETVLTGLIEKGILMIEEKEISRLDSYEKETIPLNPLNQFQQKAYERIVQQLREKNVCLLHGVTSSGKTEIYMHLIEETLKINRQVLFLLPEIALTAQITARLKKIFGNKLGVYHSRISDNERVEIWNNLLNDQSYQIILGVRSSIFLPFQDLGLVIVDEEHETGYKQQDPAPRYHARNAAIVLASMHGAKVVLGSATPSIETFYNTKIEKYAYTQLNSRFENTPLPSIIPVNTKELRRKKKMKSIFSPLLIEKMQETFDKGEQVILFQNRRGFAPMICCKDCDWVPKCSCCDVSLTYHKKLHQLTCHYCGKIYRVPTECPECANTELKSQGYGTEQVEEEMARLFPQIAIARMDTDTTKSKKSHEEIISLFEDGKAQVLIGTQMISKGLDFGNVSLVGILNADSMMNFPDFRAHERAYQLMAQVAGRAGRRQEQGEVILQTSHPEHPLIQLVLNHDYEGMYSMQLEERHLFNYPPFYRIIEISLKHKKEDVIKDMSQDLAALLRRDLGEHRVMGPDKPAIGRIQSLYIRKIRLKIEINASLEALRAILKTAHAHVLQNPVFKYAIVQYDIDPV